MTCQTKRETETDLDLDSISRYKRAIRSDGEYKFEFYCLTMDLLQVKQAYSGKGLAAKGHKTDCKMPLLTSARDTRHLGIDFRKFPVKTNKKIEVISQKPSNLDFCQKWQFLAK